MALDKTFAVGEILTASNVNAYARSMWAPIDKQVIPSGSPVTLVSFASLDSAFRIFRLTINTVATSAQIPNLRLNNDSGANYNVQENYFGHTTLSGQRQTAQTEIRLAGTSAANEPVLGEYLIAKNLATVRAMIKGGLASYHTVERQERAANWANTSVLINRIDFYYSGSVNFYGVVALEGMRGA